VLGTAFELEMQRLIENKRRGASREEGVMSPNTRDRYRQTIKHFSAFIDDVLLADINKSTIELFKIDRLRRIEELKQSRGGTSIALDIAVLHRMFQFAVDKEMMVHKPIDLSKESKPGKNPKNGARPFTAEELKKLRNAAEGDLFNFLVLRWTGLRGSDAVNLRWQDVHFDRGSNGEIEVLTQKREKLAIIPLSPELRDALDEEYSKRRPLLEDKVMVSPDTGKPFLSRVRLYERMKALGIRAGVTRVTPHCFRDTFACDMLSRGNGIFEVAKILADTVDTVDKHYAHFVPAARDAVQDSMVRGLGIEERALLY
jgi:integrase/recombinase XerC/integrase/recombinase XerD